VEHDVDSPTASRLLADKCVDGIKANKETAEAYVEISALVATAPTLPGSANDKAAEIAKEKREDRQNRREICREKPSPCRRTSVPACWTPGA